SNSTFGGGKGSFAVAFGGLSEGHRKTKSTRACAPGRRCAATRIAAGGSWNATPATVTGSGGGGIDQRPRADRPQHIADIGERAKRQRGKNTKREQETSAVAAVRLAQMLTALLGKLRGRHRGASSTVESRVRYQ